MPPTLSVGGPSAPPTLSVGGVVAPPVAPVGNFDPALISRPPRPNQKIIAVLSSKGGSGKTTCAVGLATGIARSSNEAAAAGEIDEPLSVCLIDLDVRDGQIGTLIGMHNPTALSVRSAPFIDEDVIRASMVYASNLGVDVLLAPNRPRSADGMGPEFYRTLIAAMATMWDVIVIDCSVNYLDALLGSVALPMASQVILITTPFRTSVYGVTRAVAEMTEPLDSGGLGVARSKIGIVINQATGDADVDKRDVLAAISQIEVLGTIPVAPHQLMLDATNTARLDVLLDDPEVGPAFYALARRCLPNARLREPQPNTGHDIWGYGEPEAPPAGMPAPESYGAPTYYQQPGQALQGPSGRVAPVVLPVPAPVPAVEAEPEPTQSGRTSRWGRRGR